MYKNGQFTDYRSYSNDKHRRLHHNVCIHMKEEVYDEMFLFDKSVSGLSPEFPALDVCVECGFEGCCECEAFVKARTRLGFFQLSHNFCRSHEAITLLAAF